MISTENARQDALRERREELLTVDEYAFLMKMQPATVHKRIQRGKQPGVIRSGATIRIDIQAASA
jgi:hypothetical protein